MPEHRTVLELLTLTKGFFEKKGIEGTARLDAELLLADVLGCRRIDLYVRYDEPVADEPLDTFREHVRRRGERRPVKQILGRCEFRSREFAITPDVLIPRPETEHVVEAALRRLPDGPCSVADLGTGSGCIAVSIAAERPSATVHATDASAAALAVARQNAERHDVADRVPLSEGDLFAALASVDGPLDAVVSNPPYVAESELAGLMPEVAKFEPREALVSGEDGLAHIRRLVDEAPAFLKPGGWLIVEVSPHTAGRAEQLAAESGAYDNVELLRDLNKHERVLVARKRLDGDSV
jgi:release factor glutamine methyltransferase